MTCRHSAGDPNCSSSRNYHDYSSYSSAPKTPDAEKYSIVDVEQVGNHFVMKVLYPNCASCSYEGNKVLVFLNTTPLAALKWKKIDPHFRPASKYADPREAPSPSARFPASPEGWKDALAYAKSKVNVK